MEVKIKQAKIFSRC